MKHNAWWIVTIISFIVQNNAYALRDTYLSKDVKKKHAQIFKNFSQKETYPTFQHALDKSDHKKISELFDLLTQATSFYAIQTKISESFFYSELTYFFNLWAHKQPHSLYQEARFLFFEALEEGLAYKSSQIKKPKKAWNGNLAQDEKNILKLVDEE